MYLFFIWRLDLMILMWANPLRLRHINNRNTNSYSHAEGALANRPVKIVFDFKSSDVL